jgi:hypothetical protein
MKAKVGEELKLRSFFISTVEGGEWSASHPVRFASKNTQPPFPFPGFLFSRRLLNLINALK